MSSIVEDMIRLHESPDQPLEPEPVAEPSPSPTGLFRFLDLPSEIRLRIYHFVLFTPTRKNALRSNGSVGASAKKNKPLSPLSHRLSLFLVSHRIHDEATHHFYSSQTFRLFPVQDFSRLPPLRSLPRRHRPSITTIELILGSSWTAPPRSWTVNQGLGLHEMTFLRTLKVFVQCDPSHPVFEGFRVSKDYYTEFSGRLMRQILERLPNLVQVEFDGYPSVQKSGPLMSRLLQETRDHHKKILWGPERGWTDYADDEEGHQVEDQREDQAVDAAFDGLRAHDPDPVESLGNSLQTVRLES
ncbi:hypothetical protein NUU61_005097 [Penicillium alfredii]|uniref:F-box domain-containing protein n=1 Tax=Penicillium alfredii TaxID=1506179 RepID=A0A9W9F8W8_9EURO|nr:uncharacterized protein NUU61_005097 [Penicillium alfredii]KAJ5095741.1 hypothetical protein NUU61_005097 [Penicillium alfredii]